MKASQVIHALEIRIKQHGDLPVYTQDMDYDLGEGESAGLKHLDETEHLSDCCGATIYDDMGVCTDCKEHTEVQFLPERFFIKT